MKAPGHSRLECRAAAAAEGRRYGCELRRQRLPAGADAPGGVGRRAAERWPDTRCGTLPLGAVGATTTVRWRWRREEPLRGVAS